MDSTASNWYGFLTDFQVSASRARDIIKFLSFDAGITHFQFYDCMERYEMPMNLDKKEWCDPIGRRITRESIDAYVDEIRKLNGVSLMYNGIYSVSSNYAVPSLADALFSWLPEKQEYGQEWFCLDDNPKWSFLSLVNPASGSWKEHYIPQLEKVVANVGFSGIHFDQYGSLDNRWSYAYIPKDWSFDNVQNHDCFTKVDKRSLMADFLRAFREQVKCAVTFNAADGYGFEETQEYVDFPYVELWNNESIKHWSEKLSGKDKFVIAAYTPLCESVFNWDGHYERKKMVNGCGGSYLFRGDDNRYLVGPYFPSAIKVI